MQNRHNLLRIGIILCIAIVLFASKPAFADSGAKTPSWVFIGDSYARFGSVSLSTLIAKRLKLKPKEYARYCESGYGFANKHTEYPYADHRFIRLIKNVQTDADVRNVLVIGGIGNDLHIDDMDTLEAEMTAFYTAVRITYPNAVIWHAVPNWRANQTRKSDEKILEAAHWQRQLLDREAFIRKFDRRNGVHLLTKSRTVLRCADNDSLFNKDGMHPSWKGRVRLAKAIVDEIKSSRIYQKQQAKFAKTAPKQNINRKTGSTYTQEQANKAKKEDQR